MIAAPFAPLAESTTNSVNSPPAEAPPAPCFLSLLAEASLEHQESNKRPRTTNMGAAAASLECGEVLSAETFAAEASGRPRSTTTVAEANPNRSPSASSSHSSRSTSPSSNSGKTYRCNRCAREYASTDAVRKHARQNHPEWLKEQGQGCPSLYCTPCEATDGNNGAVLEAPTGGGKQVLTPPQALAGFAVPAPIVASSGVDLPAKASAAASSMAASAPAADVPVPPSPADPAAAALLMTAAESCLALSMAAHQSDEEEEAADASAPSALFAYSADKVEAFMRAPLTAHRLSSALPPELRKQGGAGAKRPRSIRCGECDGCVRDDCGMCKNCVDKPRFGGLGQRKQGCVLKLCRLPRLQPQ